MGKTVIIVRDEATWYDASTSYRTAAGQPVEIVLDRRHAGDRRRQGAQDGPAERRRTDRRMNRDAQARLQREGFAVVHA